MEEAYYWPEYLRWKAEETDKQLKKARSKSGGGKGGKSSSRKTMGSRRKGQQ